MYMGKGLLLIVEKNRQIRSQIDRRKKRNAERMGIRYQERYRIPINRSFNKYYPYYLIRTKYLSSFQPDCLYFEGGRKKNVTVYLGLPQDIFSISHT